MEISKETLEKLEQIKLDGVELLDEELDNVSGGTDGCAPMKKTHSREYYETKEQVKFVFSVGDVVHSYLLFQPGKGAVSPVDLTKERVAKVLETNVYFNEFQRRFQDRYLLETIEGEKIINYVFRDAIIL